MRSRTMPTSAFARGANNAYNASMATLNIRNLPDLTHRELRVRAARRNRSMEAEARSILVAACGPPDARVTVGDLQRMVDEMYGAEKPANAVDDLIRERRAEATHE